MRTLIRFWLTVPVKITGSLDNPSWSIDYTALAGSALGGILGGAGAAGGAVGDTAKKGAGAVGDTVRTGQTVQFHVRDAASADDDLRELLQAAAAGPRPVGALVFTCNGRGRRLFDTPHHDARCLQDCLGPLPVAGFFAQGELGPIGDRTFLHGFTASIALFERAD